MDYVLGIDSGGTNYRVEAQDTDGHQLGYYVVSRSTITILPKRNGRTASMKILMPVWLSSVGSAARSKRLSAVPPVLTAMPTR